MRLSWPLSDLSQTLPFSPWIQFAATIPSLTEQKKSPVTGKTPILKERAQGARTKMGKVVIHLLFSPVFHFVQAPFSYLQ